MKSQLPGFNIIFENINYMKFVKSNDFSNVTINKTTSNIFQLLIFENTNIENQIYSSMPKTNLSAIENILFLKYLKRNYPKKFNEEINNFSLRFNYDIKTLNYTLKIKKKLIKNLITNIYLIIYFLIYLSLYQKKNILIHI